MADHVFNASHGYRFIVSDYVLGIFIHGSTDYSEMKIFSDMSLVVA